MIPCPECQSAMIRADLHDPEGTMPLYGGIYENGYWWVCIGGTCKDSKRNAISPSNTICCEALQKWNGR